MVYTAKAAEYLRGVGATNNKIEDFFFISIANLKMVRKKSVMRYIDLGQGR